MDWGTIDLKSLAGGSYSYRNDILSLFSQGKVVETLRIHNTTANTPGSAVLALNVERHGADILVSAGSKPYPMDQTLSNRG